MKNRVINHPVLDAIDESKTVSFKYNDQFYQGFAHESIAAALLANSIRTLRYHEESGNPRGIYCNIGHCYECRVTVNGQHNVRACLTRISEGLTITSGEKLLTTVKDWRPENE